jgi:hypothetical protein
VHEVSARPRRSRMLQALVWKRLVTQKPVRAIVENPQWNAPRVGNCLPTDPGPRPESHVTVVTTRREVRAMVDRVSISRRRQDVAERTGGILLFVEHVTRALSSLRRTAQTSAGKSRSIRACLAYPNQARARSSQKRCGKTMPYNELYGAAGSAAAPRITRGFESGDFLLIDWRTPERLASPV